MISEDNGQYLVEIAKEAISTYLETNMRIPIPEDCPDELKEELGVFVTLNKKRRLRGCIGYPEPVKSLIESTIDVAISAAFEDPRFPALKTEEYGDLEFEVTVLTQPELIEVAHPKQYFDEIEIGRDGLIIQKGYARGLLLPQVAPENGFDVETFLEHTCMKAGISADSWMDESCDVYKFQGQIFK
ncbi:TIGR00296 family protein [Methanobrevibacter sp.]|uniref:TIGR00296 family protein n=1 Tax=Methanobrevibacter sp. TaxID=66852 RepID=UPI003890000B